MADSQNEPMPEALPSAEEEKPQSPKREETLKKLEKIASAQKSQAKAKAEKPKPRTKAEAKSSVTKTTTVSGAASSLAGGIAAMIVPKSMFDIFGTTPAEVQ